MGRQLKLAAYFGAAAAAAGGGAAKAAPDAARRGAAVEVAPAQQDADEEDGRALRLAGARAQPQSRLQRQCGQREDRAATGPRSEPAAARTVPALADSSSTSSTSSSSSEGEEEEGVSAYEKQRLANIARNAALLDDMQLGEHKQEASMQLGRNKRVRSRPARRIAPRIKLPQRKSRRLQGLASSQHKQQLEELAEEDAPAEAPAAVFEASAVWKVAQGANAGAGEPPVRWLDPALKKTYGMHHHPTRDLFAAGGHGGRVAVFGSGRGADDAPLLSFKASSGWTSGVQFCGAASDDVRLLTASNDGSLCLWDTGAEAEGRAKELWRSREVHASGIFSLHEMDGTICSGGKDKRVVVSTMRQDGALAVVHAYEDEHEGVVKCVRMRDAATAASTGNDMSLRVLDLRSKSVAQSLLDADTLAVNSVRWRPGREHELVTAGFSSEMLLFDLRRPAAPVLRLSGHLEAGRRAPIYHPLFLFGGSRVAAGGQGELVTLFDAATGEVTSRGRVGAAPTALARVPGEAGRILAAAAGLQGISLVATEEGESSQTQAK